MSEVIVTVGSTLRRMSFRSTAWMVKRKVCVRRKLRRAEVLTFFGELRRAEVLAFFGELRPDMRC